jgi:dimethylamine/trimethylamine dehydrogenase
VTHEPLAGIESRAGCVFTPEALRVAGDRPAVGDRVVVYDAEGYFMGASLAELLRLEGYEVTLVTPFAQVAPWCDLTLEGKLLRERLHTLGVAFHRDVTLTAVGPEGLQGVAEFGAPFTFPADSLVLTTQRQSDDALYRELKADPQALADAEIQGLYQVGDCISPRLLTDVVFDGHRLGREIDSENPAVPLPRLREIIALPGGAG